MTIPSDKRRHFGFTLMETLIAVSLLALLAGIVLSSNITSSLRKARDSKRKTDLLKLSRILEDYYNDKQRYPPNDPSTGFIGSVAWGKPWGTIPELPKDPSSGNTQYYYDVDQSRGQYYVLYARLENGSDPDITVSGCDQGCGPSLSYNYAIHSPNVIMLAGLPSTGINPGGSGGIGGGGGGGGVPSPTSGATPTPINVVISPTPSTFPTPSPNLTPPPGATCGHNQCCFGQWCGGGQGAGIQCAYFQKCALFDYGWDCACSSQCGAFWCDP